MGIHPPAADHIPAGRGQMQFTRARGHRAGQQDRGANFAAEVGIEVRRADISGLNLPGVRVEYR